MPRIDLINIRSGTTAEWLAANPVLAKREPGYDTDTEVLKIGDGVKTWTQLTGIGDAEAFELTPGSITADMLAAPAATDTRTYVEVGPILGSSFDTDIVLPTPCDILGVRPRTNRNHKPTGRDAIADVQLVRNDVVIGPLWSDVAQRPTVPSGAIKGTERAPQLVHMQAGDVLQARAVQGGLTQEAASIIGDYQQPSTTTTGTTFTMDRPQVTDPANPIGPTIPLPYNADNPNVLMLNLWRGNQTTTVTPPAGIRQLGMNNLAGSSRQYGFLWADDGAASWTFQQSNTAQQSHHLSWYEPSASGNPIDDVEVAAAATASNTFTIPALTTTGADRMLVALVATPTASVRTPPTGWGAAGRNGVPMAPGGRCGAIRRWPGNAQGDMGPWVGGLDNSYLSGVIVVALTPRAADPGEDLTLDFRFRRTAT